MADERSELQSQRVDDAVIASIITQTDASGNQKRLASPVYDDEQNGKIGFFQRLFCCGRKNVCLPNQAKKYSVATSSSSESTGADVIRNKIQYPRVNIPHNPPQRMPEMPPPPVPRKKCLALDLDETLVHSSFQPVDIANYIIPVTIEGVVHNVYVIKRPGVDEFLRRVGQHYEVIVFTASLSKYADPLLDQLDVHGVIVKRLFRENCVFHDGHYVKDLALLSRDLSQTIIVDNSPMSYIFHPENAIDCGSFIDDPSDVEMWQLADFLESIKDVDDVREYVNYWRQWCDEHPSEIPDDEEDD